MKHSHLNLALSFSILSGITSASGVMLADFDGNGVSYIVGTFEGNEPPGVTTGGPSGSYFVLLNNIASQRPLISFDSEESDPDDDYTGWTEVTFTMDFRADGTDVNGFADGFGINFVDTAIHGHGGAVAYVNEVGGQGVEERALIPDSFGVGFRTYQGTNATITFDGADLSGDTLYNLPLINWASLVINLQRNSVTKNVTAEVTIYDQPGQAGNAQVVFSDFEIEDFQIEDFRVQVAARTGGEAMSFEIDNLELDVVVPDFQDTDGDGLPDEWEIFYGLDANDNGLNPNNNGEVGDPSQGASGDPDSDTLTNLAEFDLETNPTSDDTDDDGLTDQVEDGGGFFVGPTQTGTNPLIADTDEDGLSDGVENNTGIFVDENQTGTDPHNSDSDGDGITDGLELQLNYDPNIDEPIRSSPGLVADFDGRGEEFVDEARRSARKGYLVPGDETSDGNYYRLLENIGDTGNFISFESAADYTGWETFSFQMDYLADNVAADGFGINFLSTDVHGGSGVVPMLGDTPEERALIENSFGVGFRTFEATNATVTWNAADLSGDAPYQLTSGAWASVGIDVERDPETKDATVNVYTYDQPDRQGNEQNVFSDFAVPAMDLEDFRVQVEGRTGGAAMDLAIDNLKLVVDGLAGSQGIVISAIQTEVVRGNPDTISVTLTWNSREGEQYAILANDSLEDELIQWLELEDRYNATPGQETTSFTERGLPIGTTKRFYVVRLAE